MNTILADTGLFVALFNRRDAYHEPAKAWLKELTDPLITNLPVLTETVHLLDFHPQVALDFLRWVQRAVTIDSHTPDDLPRIEQVFTKYADVPADFADASLVALAERLGTRRIATVDADFQVYRYRGKQAFLVELGGLQ